MFFVINYIFIALKLYSDDKYKVSIKLFISFNVLLTAYILLSQVNNHTEEIYNIISKNYTDFLDTAYTVILKQLQDNKNESQLRRELFDFSANDNQITGNKIYKNLGENLDYNSVSVMDKSICCQINAAISNYALFYYTHIELAEYTILMKRQNYRMLKVIDWYLRSPTYNIMLEYYLRTSCGLYTLKYFKEIYNISQNNPINKEEELISKNKIIDGKINGTEHVVAPTTRTSKIFTEELTTHSKNKFNIFYTNSLYFCILHFIYLHLIF